MRHIDLLDESYHPLKIIWYLAWPTVLDQLLVTLVNYVDTAMVGTLGSNATASISINQSSIMLVNGIYVALAVGFGVLVGRSIGARDMDGAKKTVSTALAFAGIFGLVMSSVLLLVSPHLPVWMGAAEEIQGTASDYLAIIGSASLFQLMGMVSSSIIRCSGDTRTPLFFNLLTNVINVILNFLFIYPTRIISIFGWSFTMWGAGMGVAGAALASAIAIAFSALMLTRVLFSVTFPISVYTLKKKLSLNFAVIRQMFRLSLPVAVERLSISTGQIAITAIVAGLGTTALAANHLALTAEAIVYMPAFGFSAAATTLVAQSLGAEKPQLAMRLASYCMKLCVILLGAMGLLQFIFAPALIGLFSTVPAVITIGALCLRIEAISQPAFAVIMVTTGACRGSGDTKWPFYFSLIGMWGIRLPLTLLLVNVFKVGLPAAWIAMTADIIVRMVISLFRFRSAKWLTAWKA